jgi:hypothetical protein
MLTDSYKYTSNIDIIVTIANFQEVLVTDFYWLLLSIYVYVYDLSVLSFDYF